MRFSSICIDSDEIKIGLLQGLDSGGSIRARIVRATMRV